MNIMKYKDYIANIEYDDEDNIFIGHLIGIKDIVSFHGSTVDDLKNAFHESVDNYIAISEETGRSAQKPYSGKLMLLISPNSHATVATVAQIHGKSINQLASDTLEKAIYI